MQTFSLPSTHLRSEKFLLIFELLYRHVYDSDNKDESLLQKSKDAKLSSNRVYNEKNYHYRNFSQEEYDALINLINNKNIIIQKTDKGNTVVIIDRANYLTEMQKILSDTNKFVKVSFNSKHKVNKEIRHLLDIESSLLVTLLVSHSLLTSFWTKQ